MLSRKQSHQKSISGFTLIELLVVIAIIAILAAILFPVFGLVRENVRKSQCMTQMHDLYQAVQQYKIDRNQYPAVLYDYAELANGNYYIGSGVPVSYKSAVNRPLYKSATARYLKDADVIACPDDTSTDPSAVTPAVYPSLPGVRVGQVANYFGPANPAYYYVHDSYDVGPQVDAQGNVVKNAGNPVMEVHYALDWTGAAAGPGDAPNQLKYPSPPEDKTVLTWCTYHVATAHSNIINVLMLSGTVKPAPTDQFINKGPLKFAF